MPVTWKPRIADELAFFLVVYMVAVFGLLLVVHLLQPDRGVVQTSSPIHQERRDRSEAGH